MTGHLIKNFSQRRALKHNMIHHKFQTESPLISEKEVTSPASLSLIDLLEGHAYEILGNNAIQSSQRLTQDLSQGLGSTYKGSAKDGFSTEFPSCAPILEPYDGDVVPPPPSL